MCFDGSAFIPSNQYCDGVYHCRDLSDEVGCPPAGPACPAAQFSCRSAALCIDPRSVCDSVRDCPGGEDEFDCQIMSFEPEFGCCDGARQVAIKAMLTHTPNFVPLV